jgi:rubredoxin
MNAPFFTGVDGHTAANLAPTTRLECKICWQVYDPADGDDSRQIPPGTAFKDLPDDWCCPECGSPKNGFLVLDD